MPLPVTLADVEGARARIRPHVHETPVLTCRSLDTLAGARLFLKAENLQKTGAFKARGAVHAILSLSDDEAARGVAAHSSGNHGAALAWAAGLRGIGCTVVMPEDSRTNKVAATRAYGGDVVFCAPTLEGRETTTAALLERTGAVLVHPYDDARVIAGQGTAALEFLRQAADLDAVIVPVGGGGLIAGTLVAIKALRPSLAVIGAEPERSEDAFRSWRTGTRVAPERTDTVADGLRAGIGELNLAIVRELVDDIVLVSEDAILEATRALLRFAKTVVEPSAAVGLAALLEDRPPALADRRVGLILTGGNLDLEHPPW